MSENAMEKIGEQLSTSRQLHGFTITDVAARLRMRAMFVEALEREEWGTIGEAVYVRGFLKNYAHLLGLDPQPLLAQLCWEYELEAAQSRPAVQEFSSTSFFDNRQQLKERSGRWFPWILGALTSIAAVLVIMVAISLLGFFAPQRQIAATATASANPPSGAAASSEMTPAANSLQTSGDAQTQGSGVNLRLQLTQRSWLSVTVDGKRLVYDTLPAGTVREFHGAREIILRAGNAGGVVANIDGKDLGALGQAGQVQDRVFAVKPPADQFNGRHE